VTITLVVALHLMLNKSVQNRWNYLFNGKTFLVEKEQELFASREATLDRNSFVALLGKVCFERLQPPLVVELRHGGSPM
jgi:hypothetical protein